MTMNVARLLSPFRLLNLALAVSACADDLKTNDDGGEASKLAVETQDKSDGIRETTVNASGEDKYLPFDLDQGVAVKSDSAAWDLAFQRFKIKSNGGDSGAGHVIVAKLVSADFEALSEAPESGYTEDSDAVSSKSEGGDPNYAFLGPEPWYEYNGSNHQLSPADVVYVVRSTEEKFFKVAVTGYYDEAGSAGYPKFLWAEIKEPAQPVSAEQGEPEEPAAPGDQAVSGCYDMKVHVCECETDQAACEAAEGVWTDRCGCDAEE
jgi:hypothetical protein